jgi:uncharacterized protein (TIGR02145 family)
MYRTGKSRLSGLLFFLPLFFVSFGGHAEGTKELNTNSVQSTELYICNDFAAHCNSSAGLRSQFAAFDNTQSAEDVDRLYFVTLNASEVVYLGFKGGGLTNPVTPARHIVFRIKNLAGTIVLAEQNLPTSGTGFISTFAQALNGPNALILTPPYNGYDALVFTPPMPGTYYIEFSARRDDNNNLYIGNFNLTLFDITVGNTVTHLEKPGRLYSKSWQFYENSDFYGKNYFISDDSIVTSAQFSGMSGGHWIQYCNQTGCGNTSANWLTNRKSLYHQQALFPQYKIFLNEPDPVLFPPATTLGQIVAPMPYGVQNCVTGHILFHVAVNKPGNVEITLTFPAPYLPRTLYQAVVTGDNLLDWDGLDGTSPTGVTVPNNTLIQFTVKYINGLTNLPLYDVEGNSSGFTIALVSPVGATPPVFWDDTNIPGGINNSTLPGCTSPPGCHSWSGSSNWGDLNTINTWWYNVTTTTAPVSIMVFRGPQTLVFVQQPPQVFCANTGGHVFSVNPDINTDVYHWSYNPPAGVTISQLAPGSYTVTVTLGPTASSGQLQVYGSNTNCAMTGPTSSLAITINPNPTPTLTGPVTACTGQTNVTYTTEAGKTNYQWTVSTGGTITGGGTSTSNTVTVTWNTAGARSVSVNYQSGTALCSSPTPTILNVTVNSRPVPVLTGSSSVCAGSAGNIYSTAAGKTNYVWTISSGGTITSGGTPTSNTATVTWNTAGAQTISVNYTDPVTLCAAASPTILNVTVNARPVPVLTGSNTVCSGSTTVVYSTTPGKINYSWAISSGGNITAGGTSTSNTATVTWNTAGAQTISVNYTDPVTLCSGASPTILNITVNSRPVPLLSGSTLVCVNTSNVVYTTDPGKSNYIWAISSGGTITSGGNSTSNTATVTWNTTGSQTISVSYTDPVTLCTTASPTVVNVSVNNLPTPTFLSGSNSACLEVPGNIYTTEPGMVNYVWIISGGMVTGGGTSTDPSVTVTWNSTGQHSVSVNYTYPFTICTSPVPTTLLVNVNPLPTPSVISGNSIVCKDVPGNTYTTQTGMLAYQWSVAGGAITAGGDPGSNFATVTWSNVGVQSIAINYTDPVTNCMAASPVSFPVTVKPLPVPSFISGENSVCLNIPGHVYATQPGMNSYIWSVAGGSITGGGNSTDNSATVTWSVEGAQSISVSYTDPVTQCTAASPVSFPVNVKPLPVPVFTAGVDSVCLNAPGNVYLTQPGMLNYVWTITGGQITAGGSNTSNSATVTWNTLGTHSIQVNFTDPVTLCTAAVPTAFSVIVKPLPVPTIAGPGAACLNTAGPQYSTEAGMSNYLWTVPQGTVTAGPAPDIIHVVWNTQGMQTMTVSYTGQNGCDPAVPSPKTVLVNTLPVPVIIGQTSICTGILTTYTTESGMQDYSWLVSSGGTVISGGTPADNTATVSWTLPGMQEVSVNYALGTGCIAAVPSTLAVTVYQSTPPVIDDSPQGLNCVTFGKTYTTQPGMSGYLWTVSPGGTITSASNANAINVTWNSVGPQWVRVNFTNTFGCTGQTPTQFDVMVNPLPVTTIIAGPGPDCEFIPHSYQVPPDPGCTFNWAISPPSLGLITAGQGFNAVTIGWQSFGTAVISVYGVNNSTGCYSSSNYTTIVNPRPEPTFTPCFDVATTPGAKTFFLRGASPFLAGQGVFSGSRVSLNTAAGEYEFDPFGASPGIYPVTYTYTNTFGCPASPPVVNITVQNSAFFCGGNLTDVRDGKIYKTAMIGGKCWMAENFNFGTIISGYLPSTDNCTDEKYCQPADVNCTVYGGLYQWEELMRYGTTTANKGICPPEWHVPAEAEWQLMLTSLGTGTNPPDGIAGSFLKDSFLSNGFDAILTGLFYLNSTWAYTSGNLTGTMYWTSTQTGPGQAAARGVNNQNPSTSRYHGSMENAFSLRCVKDL